MGNKAVSLTLRCDDSGGDCVVHLGGHARRVMLLEDCHGYLSLAARKPGPRHHRATDPQTERVQLRGCPPRCPSALTDRVSGRTVRFHSGRPGGGALQDLMRGTTQLPLAVAARSTRRTLVDPDRSVGGLNGSAYDVEQVRSYRVEVDGFSQSRRKRSDSGIRVVARAIETPVDQTLDAGSHRVEQGCGR